MLPRHASLSMLGLLCWASVVGANSSLQAVTHVDSTQVPLNQPLRVTVEVRNSMGLPDIQAPQTPDLTIGPPSAPLFRSSLMAGVQNFQPGMGNMPGQRTIQALNELANKIPTGMFDPSQTANMQATGASPQDMQNALAALADLKRNDYLVTYLVQPQKTGPVVLPAFTVRAGGQTAATQPVALNVSAPQKQQWVQARLSLSNPAPAPGDEVQLFMDLLIRRGPVTYGGKVFPHYPVKDVYLNVPTLRNLPQVEVLKPLEDVVSERLVAPGHKGFHINNLPGEMLLEHEANPGQVGPDDDPTWYRRRLTLPLRIRQTGTVQLSPIRAIGEVLVPGTNRWQTFAVSSEPLSFRVRAGGNRPNEYTGAVGVFRLTAKASQTRMPVGAPFGLKLRLEGQGDLSQVRAPDLAKQPGFEHFVVHLDNDLPISRQEREFTYTLRPRSVKATQVPVVSVAYYNPQGHLYEKARSQPIPLQVTPAAVSTADAPAESEAAPASAPTQETPSLLPWIGVGIGLLLASGTLLLAARGGKRWRQRRVQHGQQIAALQAIQGRLLVPSLTVEDVRQTLQDYLRLRFQLPPGEITPLDAEERLLQAGHDSRLARRWGELLRDCETAEFAPGLAQPAAQLAACAREMIRTLQSARPMANQTRAGVVDELTRARQAAVSG